MQKVNSFSEGTSIEKVKAFLKHPLGRLAMSLMITILFGVKNLKEQFKKKLKDLRKRLEKHSLRLGV